MSGESTASRTAGEHDRAVLAALPALAGLLAACAAVLGVAAPLVATGPVGRPTGLVVAPATATALAGLAVLARRGSLPRGTGHPITAGLTVLVAATAAALVLVTREAADLGHLQLAVVLAGAVLVARPWLVTVLAVSWVMWMGCALALAGPVSWPREVLSLLAATVLAVGLSESRRRNLRDLDRARRAAEAEAVCDHLTGLSNRRGLALLGNQVLELARRRGDAVHAVFLDVDGLKSVNDRLGHEAGDAVLRGIADALRSVTRATDVAARWGGDEFCLVGPGPGGHVLDLDRRVRSWLLAHPPVDPAVWPASISLGAARYAATELSSLEKLLADADAAMYGGRDRRRARGQPPAPARDSDPRAAARPG